MDTNPVKSIRKHLSTYLHIKYLHVYISTHSISTHNILYPGELQPAPARAAVGVRAGLVARGQLGRQGGDPQRGPVPGHQPRWGIYLV